MARCKQINAIQEAIDADKSAHKVTLEWVRTILGEMKLIRGVVLSNQSELLAQIVSESERVQRGYLEVLQSKVKSREENVLRLHD